MKSLWSHVCKQKCPGTCQTPHSARHHGNETPHSIATNFFKVNKINSSPNASPLSKDNLRLGVSSHAHNRHTMPQYHVEKEEEKKPPRSL